MKYLVWHTGPARSLRISRIPEVYPEASLQAVLEPDNTISVRSAENQLFILSKLPHTRYAREDGSGFVNHIECMAYLESEFAKKYEAEEIKWQKSEW